MTTRDKNMIEEYYKEIEETEAFYAELGDDYKAHCQYKCEQLYEAIWSLLKEIEEEEAEGK